MTFNEIPRLLPEPPRLLPSSSQTPPRASQTPPRASQTPPRLLPGPDPPRASQTPPRASQIRARESIGDPPGIIRPLNYVSTWAPRCTPPHKESIHNRSESNEIQRNSLKHSWGLPDSSQATPRAPLANRRSDVVVRVGKAPLASTIFPDATTSYYYIILLLNTSYYYLILALTSSY